MDLLNMGLLNLRLSDLENLTGETIILRTVISREPGNKQEMREIVIPPAGPVVSAWATYSRVGVAKTDNEECIIEFYRISYTDLEGLEKLLQLKPGKLAIVTHNAFKAIERDPALRKMMKNRITCLPKNARRYQIGRQTIVEIVEPIAFQIL